MSTASKKPKIGAIAPWYGGNRLLAEHVGRALDGCEWVGIPFAGGMAEIAEIKARTIVANDLHGGVIELARWLGESDQPGVQDLQLCLRRQLFHPDSLAYAQHKLQCCDWNDREVAVAFFVVAWMTRSGTAGTDAEKTAKLCLRWEAGGGDSRKRYDSAIDSLPYWSEQFQRCTFSTLDCFEFLRKCKDRPRHGIYCDPPFPGPGDKYTHTFSEADHLLLAARLEEFTEARVVIRYYDHPLIRELYPAPHWTWTHLEGRKQTNDSAPEVLIVNHPTDDAEP